MVSICRQDKNNSHQHCNKCSALINQVFKDGIEALATTDIRPCSQYADDPSRYVLRCLVEAYDQRSHIFVKPTIITDGRFDHYNNRYDKDYDLEDVIIRSDTDILLIYGESGIGKSTLMNVLYQTVSLYSLRNGCCILPIFLHGSSYGGEEEKPLDFIQRILKSKFQNIDMTPALFSREVQVIIFLDAINDIQYTNYEDLQRKLALWRSFILESFALYPGVKFVISSKYLDSLSEFEIHNYMRMFLEPWENDKVEEFLDAVDCPSENRVELLKLFKRNDMPFLRIPYFFNRMISFSGSAVQSKTDVVELFIEEIIKQNVRSNAYFANIKEQASFCGRFCTDIRLNGTTFLSTLSEMAFKKAQITSELISEYVKDETKHFVQLAVNCSILVSVDSKLTKSKRFRFTHNIIEDFFVARYIVTKLEGRFDSFSAEELPVIKDRDRFSLALRHVYNFLPNKKHLIEALIQGNYLSFAADCALESEDAVVQGIVTGNIINFLNTNERIDSKSIEYGLYLGRLGDIRILPDLDNKNHDYIAPPTVSVGNTGLCVGVFPVTNLEYSYFIKDNGYKDERYWIDESRQWFEYDKKIESICSFWINVQDRLKSNLDEFYEFCKNHYFDKELIANLVFFKRIPQDEFRGMIRDLYSKEKESVPLMWDNPLYNNNSQPVVGVSIYEAFAYCEWLKSKTGKPYRLLTHLEWEQVAHSSSLRYAYGRHFDAYQCNTSETNLKRVIPVGICRTNYTRDGVYDLTGNIFEWTSTLYHVDEDVSTTLGSNLHLFRQYICKGGSWIQDSQRAESRYVGRGMGWVRNLDLGFRVCYLS